MLLVLKKDYKCCKGRYFVRKGNIYLLPAVKIKNSFGKTVQKPKQGCWVGPPYSLLAYMSGNSI